MKIRGNKNLELSLPYGAIGQFDKYKTDYVGLIIKNIERAGDSKLRLDVQDNNNELRISLDAKNEEGKGDLGLIENNKEKFVGRGIEEALDVEL